MGQASDPAEALAQADIFCYPLQREHYGTPDGTRKFEEVIAISVPFRLLN
jgi:hypothetical protein